MLPTLYLLLATLLADPRVIGAPPDPMALLKRSDTVRNAWPSFVVKIKISNFEAGKQDEEHVYQVSQKGAERTYVEFLSPREKGRHLLMVGDDMWIYLPDTSRPVRITPLERLTGNASNGDVARTNYSVDYEAAYLRGEQVDNVPCHVIELSARRKGSTYRKIHYWLRANDARPVKADFFLASGRLIKSATFDQFQQVAGKTLLRRLSIYDRVRQTSQSVMDYLEYSPRELPDRMFHQGRAERF
ncbi:MAG: outer membrane lipoprotein-sorting protein [Acidobacteria bacterium]|nr:outer membrane lipoprotein-sorting protein [Acidobacteriota bacterium]